MKKYIFTILGSAGGVATALLSVLNHSNNDPHSPLFPILCNSHFYLIDSTQKPRNYYAEYYPHLISNCTIFEFEIDGEEMMKRHISETNTNILIDVSWADTNHMLKLCDELGVYYVNTAIENPSLDKKENEYQGFLIMERLFAVDRIKESLKNTKAIICSGMNPGIVEWMAIYMLEKHKEEPLALYIVEQDTTFFYNSEEAEEKTIYTTWSPECYLEEAIGTYPMYMKQNNALFFYESPIAYEYKVTLGDIHFSGSLMAHEEVYTLGKLFSFESGFIYKINDHTTNIIHSALSNVDELWNYDLQLLHPVKSKLKGDDLVGVLLVYEDKERFLYNPMNNNNVYQTFKTNATYFQVSCGIYAALSVLLLDSIPNGVFYVDELLLQTENNYGTYVKYYMTELIEGENETSEGFLLDRKNRRS